MASTCTAKLDQGRALEHQGPQFAALHPLFETFAVGLDLHNDTIAERAVTLGAKAYGTARHVAKASKLPEYPQDTTRDLEHVKLLSERIETYLEGARESRGIAEKNGDTQTADQGSVKVALRNFLAGNA